MKKKNIGKEMPYMSPLINREEASKQKGYAENFEINDATRMTSTSTKKTYKPADVIVVNHYRFEGMSDPGDNNILYEIETKDGRKGILITPYGNDCPAHVAEFVAAIPQIEKQHQDTPMATEGSVAAQ